MKRSEIVIVALVVVVVAAVAAVARSRETSEPFVDANKQRGILDALTIMIGAFIISEVKDENSFLHPTTGKAAFQKLLTENYFPKSADAIANKIWAPLRTYILNAPFDTGKTLDFVSLRAKIVALLDTVVVDEDIDAEYLKKLSLGYVMLRDAPTDADVKARANAILCAKASATTYDAFKTAFTDLMKKVDPTLTASNDVVQAYSSYYIWKMAQAVTRADLPNGFDKMAGLAAAISIQVTMERLVEDKMAAMDKIKSDCSVVHCCQQIDDPTNKWTDCNPCSKSVMMCQNLSSKDTCDASSKYCTWNATTNACKSKVGVLYGEDSTTCSVTTHVCFNNAEGTRGGGSGGSGTRMVITLDEETKADDTKVDDKKTGEADKAAAEKAAADKAAANKAAADKAAANKAAADKAAADKAAADKAAADKKKLMIAGAVLLGILVIFAVIAILHYAFKDRGATDNPAPAI